MGSDFSSGLEDLISAPPQAPAEEPTSAGLGADPSKTLMREAVRYGLKKTSGLRTRGQQDALIRQGKTKAKNSYHLYEGDTGAFDFGGDPQKMADFTRDMHAKYGTELSELFHEPVGSYKFGKSIAPVAKHQTHVHIAWGGRGQKDTGQLPPVTGHPTAGFTSGLEDLIQAPSSQEPHAAAASDFAAGLEDLVQAPAPPSQVQQPVAPLNLSRVDVQSILADKMPEAPTFQPLAPGALPGLQIPTSPATVARADAQPSEDVELGIPAIPKTSGELLTRINQLRSAGEKAAPGGKLAGEVSEAVYKSHIQPELKKLTDQYNAQRKAQSAKPRVVRPSGIAGDELQQFEDLKANVYTLPEGSDERTKAVEAAKEKAKALKSKYRSAVEIGGLEGDSPYVKAASRKGVAPEDLTKQKVDAFEGRINELTTEIDRLAAIRPKATEQPDNYENIEKQKQADSAQNQRLRERAQLQRTVADLKAGKGPQLPDLKSQLAELEKAREVTLHTAAASKDEDAQRKLYEAANQQHSKVQLLKKYIDTEESGHIAHPALLEAVNKQAPETQEEQNAKLPWYLKGVTANLAHSILSLPVSIEKMALGAERFAGLAPKASEGTQEGFAEHIQSAEHGLAEIAARGGSGFGPDAQRLVGGLLVKLPMYAGASGLGGLVGPATETAAIGGMAALEKTGEPDQPSLKDIGKEALAAASMVPIYKASGLIPNRALRIGAAASGGAGITALSGGDAQDIISSAIITGIFAYPGGSKSPFALNPEKPPRYLRPVLDDMANVLTKEHGASPEQAQEAVAKMWRDNVTHAEESGMNPLEVRKRGRAFMDEYLKSKEAGVQKETQTATAQRRLGTGEEPARTAKEEVPLPKTPAPAEPPTAEASVPFMVTREMKSRLRSMDISEADINKMTPEEAHRILKGKEAPSADQTELRGPGGREAVARVEESAKTGAPVEEPAKGTQAAAVTTEEIAQAKGGEGLAQRTGKSILEQAGPHGEGDTTIGNEARSVAGESQVDRVRDSSKAIERTEEGQIASAGKPAKGAAPETAPPQRDIEAMAKRLGGIHPKSVEKFYSAFDRLRASVAENRKATQIQALKELRDVTDLSNKNLRKLFTEETGIVLPKTIHETGMALTGWMRKGAPLAAKTEGKVVAEGEAQIPGEAGRLKRERVERRKAERERDTDAITGLQSQGAWERARDAIDKDPTRAVIQIDLNDFKLLNDTHGHKAGDNALRRYAEAVQKAVPKAQMVARSGGDEISLGVPAKMAPVAARLIKAIKVKEGTITVTGAVGHGATYEEADAAASAHKKELRNTGLIGERGQAATGLAKTVDTAAHEAATSSENKLPQPTEAQKEAGNFQKGHTQVGGLDIAIENPEGSRRRPEWPALKSHYGYIKRTGGADGEQVDAFIKPGTATEHAGPVFVVNQAKGNGQFDEHKAMVGWPTEKAARAAYLESYTKGWDRIKSIARFENPTDFKQWLDKGDLMKPAPTKGERFKQTLETRRAAKAPPVEQPAARKPSRVSASPEVEKKLASVRDQNAKDAEDFKKEFARLQGTALPEALQPGETPQRGSSGIAEATWRDKRGYLAFNSSAMMWLSRIYTRAVKSEKALEIGGLTLDRGGALHYAEVADHLATEIGFPRGVWNLKAVAAALRDAASQREEFVVIPNVGLSGRPTIRHELTHEAQLALERFYQRSPTAAQLQALPGFAKAREGLIKRGYEAFADDARFMAKEVAAHIAGGQGNLIGLSLAEGTAFLRGYFERLATLYGSDALVRFKDLTKAHKEVRDAVRGEIRDAENILGLRGRPTGRGLREGVSRVPERGRQGPAEVSDQAGQKALPQIDVADLSPALRAPLARIARRFVENGLTDFDQLAGEFEELLGLDAFDEIAEHLPGILEEEQAKFEGVQAETPERLAAHFGRAFAGERSFKTIVDARKWAAQIMSIEVKPGTVETKMVDEAIESGVVQAAREIVRLSMPESQKYNRLVHLYENQQPNLGSKTSGSVLRQAYSTPIPVAYVASVLAGINKDSTVFEPTAGNGALLIEAEPDNVVANEIDPVRAKSLKDSLPGSTVAQEDATDYRPIRKVDVVIANPPFGAVKDEKGRSKEWDIAGKYKTIEVDHAIAWKALEAMKDDGRAVLILGGINSEDVAVRSDGYNGKQKRLFYYTLYNNYNVVDHFTVSGDLYQKQGAGWPIDMIVIQGRGKSARALPAVDVPRIYKSFEQLEEVLNAPYKVSPRVAAQPGAISRVSQPGQELPATARGGGVAKQPAGLQPGELASATRGESPVVTEPGVRPGKRTQGGVSATGERGTIGRTPAGRSERGGQLAGIPERAAEGIPVAAEPAGTTTEEAALRRPEGEKPAEQRESRKVDERAAREAERAAGQPTAPAEEGSGAAAKQVTYQPFSKTDAIGTLVPINLVTTTKQALEQLTDRVGDLDDYVAERLKYAPNEIGNYFSAEQVDALALALSNMESGAGFIIGDQTGIGKGRVVAAIIRYAIQQGRVPIFVTEKPNLYKDIYRDLSDIGMPNVRPLMTNAAQRLALDDEETKVLKSLDSKAHNGLLMRMAENGSIGDHDVIFTTYSQMQTVKGASTPRQAFLRAFAQDGIVIFDESHNAGGAEKKEDEKSQEQPDRAAFARHIAGLAHGVFYSSATYAKRPQVMDLYFTTDMKLAVQNQVSKLGPAIQQGGVPLQQVVASMLTEAGQYIRRERSFEGVNYDTRIAPVDQASAEGVSSVMRKIQEFDKIKGSAVEAMKKSLKAEASALGADASTGSSGVHSTNFTSIMHNLIDQMLLSLKMDAAVDEAIQALGRNEKPIITVANTMGSFIQNYAETNDLHPGDAMGLDFGDLLKRYLERSREILIGKAYEQKVRHYLTDEELGPIGVAMYREVGKAIESTDWTKMPISPIDYIKQKLTDAGHKVGEITGRHHTIDYSAGTPRYKLRSQQEINVAGRNKTISGFNGGQLDALIINQAGSTGLSLHASEKFRDQRRRFMVIAQAERNIDTHMQLLGRVHRTGQVVTPNYVQMVADIPAEKRPAAVLAKKMASLNANTTASRGGALTAKDIVDFMNEYGDEVAASLLEDDPDLHKKLGSPLKDNETGSGLSREDAIRRATGRIPLLPIAQQEHLYDQIEDGYNELLARLDAMGENALEARTLELDAKGLSKVPVFEGVPGSTSPFAKGADAEIMEVKRLGKPMTSEQVLDVLRLHFGAEGDVGLSDYQRMGRNERDNTMQDLRQRFQDYKIKTLDAIENPDRREAQEARLGDVATRLSDAFKALPVGQTVEMGSLQGVFYGIVSKFEQKGNPKNPLALGSWRVTVLVADGMRQITVPVSKIFTETPSDGLSSGEVVIQPKEHVPGLKVSVLQYFDQAQTESREKRTIITGNLLAGFSRFPKGQIINFRDHEGSIRQGILMPRSFNVDKAMEDEAVAFKSADQALSFLDGGTAASRMIETPDAAMKISHQGRGEYLFSVPASKAVGGRYFLNSAILEAAQAEFVKSGSRMQLRVDRQAAKRVLATMLSDGAVLNTKSFKEAAREITGTTIGAAPKTAKTEAESRAEGPRNTILPQMGGRPIGLADWFRSRRNPITGQFAPIRAAYDALSGGSRASVLAGWDKFLNLTVRNLSHLKRVSPESHTAALRTGGSRGQATVLLQLAIAKIERELEGSGITWPAMRAALVEGRLRGIRERYLDFAQQAYEATDEELVDSLQEGLLQVLSAIQGKAGLDDTLAQRAVALMTSDSFDELRDFLGGTFEIAADHVGRVAMGPRQNAFEELTEQPKFQKALALYKELIEKPVAESHAVNEGVFSDALGPLDTYYPLIATKQDGGILHRIFGATKFPYRKPKNIANYFATGLSEHGYSLKMDDLSERLKVAIRTNNKANLLRELHDNGLIRLLGRHEKAGNSITIDGEEVPAEVVDTQADLLIVKDGKSIHLPGARALIPTWLKSELKLILEREKLEPGMGDALINKVIEVSLIGPMDLMFHGTNILGTLVANTPFIAKSLEGHGPAAKVALVGFNIATNLPFSKWLTAIVTILRTDPTTAEGVKDLMEMANLGLIPPRFGSKTYSKRYAEATGAKRTFGSGPLLYGPKGLDVRARLAMWRFAKQINPDASPQQLFDFVSQLGIYNRELESQVERWAKATRLAPFATAGTTMLRNGVNAWTGAGPMPADGAAKQAAFRVAQMLSGGAVGLLLMWALIYKYYKDEWPWEDPEARLLQIPLKPEHRMSKTGQLLYGPDPTKTGYVNLSFFSPLVSRGGRTAGLSGAFETRRLGGSKGQQLEYAQRDILNSFTHPFTSGPLVRAPFVFLTGNEPSLTSMRDITGRFGPQFFPATVKAAPGVPTLAARGEEAIFNINPFFKTAAGGLGIGSEADRMQKQQANRWVRMASDLVAPRLIGGTVDVLAKKERIARELKASTSVPLPESKMPDDVRLEMHKRELIPSKPQRLENEADPEYLKRAERAAGEIAERVRSLAKTEAYGALDEKGKKEALESIIKDSRHDATAKPAQPEGERKLAIRQAEVEDELRAKIEARPAYQALTKEQKSQVHRQVTDLLSPFTTTKDIERMPAEGRKARAEKSLMVLENWYQRGILEMQIDKMIERAKKRAA